MKAFFCFAGFVMSLAVLSRVAAQDTSVATPESSVALPATDDGLDGVGPIRRYDWFQKLWLKKRSDWAQRTEQDQGALVFLGDSITQGWGEGMGGSFPGVQVANRGISGDTTRGMLIRLDGDVLALDPAGVVLLMGTNDLEEHATPEQIAQNADLILQALRKHNPQMPVVLCRVFPSSASKSRPAEKIKKVNELYAKIVREYASVVLLDTWTLFANSEGDAKKSEFPDLLHPNATGYAKWAAALRPVLATFGFVDKTPKPFELESGFTGLFNGKNLDGWCLLPTSEEMRKQRSRWRANNPGAPPWPIVEERQELAGKTQSPDGRYVAIADRLVVTIPPEGRRIQQLWTAAEFPNDFVLKLEFRTTPNADSGVFLRGRQLQCRDFPLAGPYKDLKQYRPGEWNELVVEVKGTKAHCTCNGELLEAAFEIPQSGPIGLEGDRGQIEYRRIRIKTQP